MDDSHDHLSDALSLMQTALSLIDRAATAHGVGAHLDLAISRMSEFLAVGGSETPEEIQKSAALA